MLLPVPTAVPPQLPLYHLQLALVPREPPLTLRETVELPQVESVLAMMAEATVLAEFTVMVLDAQLVVLQVPSARTK